MRMYSQLVVSYKEVFVDGFLAYRGLDHLAPLGGVLAGRPDHTLSKIQTPLS